MAKEYCGSKSWQKTVLLDTIGPVKIGRACKKHDVCYCDWGKSKLYCDLKFLRDMQKEIEKLEGWDLLYYLPAEITAYLYYGAVVAGGWDAFVECQNANRPPGADPIVGPDTSSGGGTSLYGEILRESKYIAQLEERMDGYGDWKDERMIGGLEDQVSVLETWIRNGSVEQNPWDVNTLDDAYRRTEDYRVMIFRYQHSHSTDDELLAERAKIRAELNAIHGIVWGACGSCLWVGDPDEIPYITEDSKLILVANSNRSKLELHKKECTWAQKILPKNRVNIYAPEGEVRDLYGKGEQAIPYEVRENLIKKIGFDGCYYCLRTWHTK